MLSPNGAKRFTLIAITYILCFTVFAVCDVFVFSHGYSTEQSGTSEVALDMENAVITETSYNDGNVSITLSDSRVADTDIHVADIIVSSPSYLKTAFAHNTYGKNIIDVTSNMASEHNAILAVNGDYYGVQQAGYVIRNGSLYRDIPADDNREDMVIYKDGSVEIISEGEISAQDLLDSGAQQVFSFGPALINNGEITVATDTEVDLAKTTNPRTAIGIIAPNHYIMVASDGRSDKSVGLSLYQLAHFMRACGAETAYNLDGGGSSTMVFNGKIINSPTSDGEVFRERNVSDIVYIG